MNKFLGREAQNVHLEFKSPHEQGKKDEKGNKFLEYQMDLGYTVEGRIIEGWAKKRAREREDGFPGEWIHDDPETLEKAVLTSVEKRLLLGEERAGYDDENED